MEQQPFKVIIPARYASTRLPGKALLDIAGKPMIQHVYERAKQSAAQDIIIATDDQRIAELATTFAAKVCMTAVTHPTGTDRIAETCAQLALAEDDVIVNVQGDEPFISPAAIQQVAALLWQHKEAAIATLCERITQRDDLLNPNMTKVVRDQHQFALYFSRSVIPWNQKEFLQQIIPSEHYRHIGIYAYRVSFIKHYVTLAQSPIEKLESLEQLRALWYGYKIIVADSKADAAFGIDTEDDLIKAREIANHKM